MQRSAAGATAPTLTTIDQGSERSRRPVAPAASAKGAQVKSIATRARGAAEVLRRNDEAHETGARRTQAPHGEPHVRSGAGARALHKEAHEDANAQGAMALGGKARELPPAAGAEIVRLNEAGHAGEGTA